MSHQRPEKQMDDRRIGAADGQPKMAECAALFRLTLAGADYSSARLDHDCRV